MADEEEYVVTQWNCSDCGLEGIPSLKEDLSPQNECPRCEQPRNEWVTPSEEEYIPTNVTWSKDHRLADIADDGQDWICDHCGRTNSKSRKKCKKCGHPYDGKDWQVRQVIYSDDGTDTPQDLDADRVDAVLRSADVLQELEDQAVSQPTRRLHSRHQYDRPTSQYAIEDTSEPDGNYTTLGRKTRRAGLSLPKLPLARFGKYALIALGAVLAVVAGWWVYSNFFATHTVDVTVTSMSWKREVRVEEWRTLTQGGWRAELPADARIISTVKRQNGTKQVFDHWGYRDRTRQVPDGTRRDSYDCSTYTTSKNGNGTATRTRHSKTCYRNVPKTKTEHYTERYPVNRTEPTYGTWCTYQIDRWVPDHYDPAQGDQTVTPYWPEAQLHNSRQRESDTRFRVESYYVKVASEGREYEMAAPNQATWSRVHLGDVLKAEANPKGWVLGIHWDQV